jgi:hypothetical protein
MAADQTDENALADVHGALIYIFDTGKTGANSPANSSWFSDPHRLHAIFHLQRHHIKAGVSDCQSENAGYYVRMFVSNRCSVKKQ